MSSQQVAVSLSFNSASHWIQCFWLQRFNFYVYLFAGGLPRGATEAALASLLCVSHQLYTVASEQNNIMQQMVLTMQNIAERLEVRWRWTKECCKLNLICLCWLFVNARKPTTIIELSIHRCQQARQTRALTKEALIGWRPYFRCGTWCQQ